MSENDSARDMGAEDSRPKPSKRLVKVGKKSARGRISPTDPSYTAQHEAKPSIYRIRKDSVRKGQRVYRGKYEARAINWDDYQLRDDEQPIRWKPERSRREEPVPEDPYENLTEPENIGEKSEPVREREKPESVREKSETAKAPVGKLVLNRSRSERNISGKSPLKSVADSVEPPEKSVTSPNGKRSDKTKMDKKDSNAVNILVKISSIVASLVIIMAMVLNMPIFRDVDTQSNVSMMYLVKNWQPLVQGEGQLNKENVKIELKDDIEQPVEDYTDGLDLPQLVEGQYSVLLLGFDEDVFNTDVMWVCQFDIGHGGLNILQIPRDCCLPDYTNSITGKINSVYSMGDPDVNPPIQRVVNAVQENFGIPIDAYVTTVCYDIVDIVDLIGGIPIDIENQIVYEAHKVIPAGKTVLTGEQAEWFIRFRYEWIEGDIGRMQNQRKFMVAAMNKLMSIVKDEGKPKLYSYLKEIYDNEYIYTDMSLQDMSMLADFAATLEMDKVHVNMVPGEGASYYPADGERYDVFSVHKQATIDMLNEYFRPYQKKMTEKDTSLVELVTDYQYDVYDDMGATFEEVEDATEPARNPDKAPIEGNY